METLVKRFGLAALMGVGWAAVWLAVGLVLGPLYVGELEPEYIGGPLYAGFVCGAVFSVLTGIAPGRQQLLDLSPYHAAAWGAVAGACVGVLPFVLGDDGSYSAGWAMTIVGTASIAAAIGATRLRSGVLSPGQAAVLAVIVSGLLSGVRLWVFGDHDGLVRYLPLALITGLSSLSALSAFFSVPVARWFTRQNESTA